MKLKKMAALTAAASLAIAPVAVQAADSLAPAVERIGATEANGSQNLEGENGILIALLAAAAVIAGIIIIADGDDEPTSP